jgi:hypothetical protein
MPWVWLPPFQCRADKRIVPGHGWPEHRVRCLTATRTATRRTKATERTKATAARNHVTRSAVGAPDADRRPCNSGSRSTRPARVPSPNRAVRCGSAASMFRGGSCTLVVVLIGARPAVACAVDVVVALLGGALLCVRGSRTVGRSVRSWRFCLWWLGGGLGRVGAVIGAMQWRRGRSACG